MIRAVLFDLGRTLVGDPRRNAWEVLRGSRSPLPGLRGPALVAALTRADREVDSPEFSHFLGERAIAKRALEILGRDIAPGDVDRLFDAYRDAALKVLRTDPQMAPLKGSLLEELLHGLRAAGVERLGIVSNERQANAITYLTEVLRVPPTSFDVVLTAESAGVGKPNPAILLAALAEISIDPQNAVYVGDSVDLDVLPARSVGMTPVLFAGLTDGGPSAVPAGISVLRELGELLTFVSRLNGAAHKPLGLGLHSPNRPPVGEAEHSDVT